MKKDSLINKYTSFFKEHGPQHALTLSSVYKTSNWLNSLSNEDIIVLQKEMFENLSLFKESDVIFLIFVVKETNSNKFKKVIKKYFELYSDAGITDAKRYAVNLLDFKLND